MIVRGMNEAEATHEFGKMKERLYKKVEDDFINPLLPDILRKVRKTGSCIMKPRKFTMDNMHFIYEDKFESCNGMLTGKHTFYVQDLEINKRVYKYVKIMLLANTVTCFYFTNHYFERIRERNGFLNEMMQFNMVRKASDVNRNYGFINHIKHSDLNSTFDDINEFKKAMCSFSDDGMSIILFNESDRDDRIEQSIIHLTFVGKDLYSPLQKYGEMSSKLSVDIIREFFGKYPEIMFDSEKSYIIKMLIRSMVSMYIESSSDKSIRKQARKANKIYYNNMLMGNLNMLSLKLYKRSWDKLDENSKRIIIVNLLSELMFPNNMYDKVIDVAMRL